jgi:hypothetical protein
MTTLEIVLSVSCFVMLHAGVFAAMLASVWKRKCDRMENEYYERKRKERR